MNRFKRKALCLVLGITVAACGEDSVAPMGEAAPGKVIVQTQRLEAQPWVYEIESFAQLQAAETVEIGVETAGTVRRVLVKDGQAVKAGDLLFELDKTKHKLRAEQAQASVAEARSAVEQSRQTWQRLSALKSNVAASKEQLQQARSAYDGAKARLKQAQALSHIAATELQERSILSPVNGVVESESVEPGQQVQPGRVLMQIQADGAFQVLSYVNEEEVLQLQSGQKAAVDVAGLNLQAHIESIAASASERTGNFEVKLRLAEKAAGLREGMSAGVTLPVTSRQSVIHIPRDALVDRNRKRVVFILDGDVIRSREVQLGLPDGEAFPVLSGLRSGEVLVTAPMNQLTDGMQVQQKASTE
jgi:RND family efflux transporter MFP subunit